MTENAAIEAQHETFKKISYMAEYLCHKNIDVCDLLHIVSYLIKHTTWPP